MSLVVHYSRSFFQFPWHEVTRSIATPPGWDASTSQVTPSISSGFPDSLLVPIYTPGLERGTVKYLPQEHNTMTRPGLEPDLSIRSPAL